MAAIEVRLRRGTTAQIAAFTGAQAELTYDSDIDRLQIHDGVAAGGIAIPNAPDVLNQTVVSGDISGPDSTGEYSVTLDPVPTAYTKYMRIVGVVAGASVGNDTLSVNGLAGKTIKQNGGADNLSSSTLIAGGLYSFVYDGVDFQVENTGGGGLILQIIQKDITEGSTSTTTPALDDTVPLVSEGVEIASQAITLTDTANKVLITVSCVMHLPSANTAGFHIFRDSTSVASAAIRTSAGTGTKTMHMEVLDTPSGNVTYSLRVGVTAGTLYHARTTTTANFGGSAINKFILKEVKV